MWIANKVYWKLKVNRTNKSIYTYFNIIIHREVADGKSILPSSPRELFQYICQIIMMFLEQLVENRAILETCVHTLPVEWYNRMSGVTDNESFVAYVIWTALEKTVDFKMRK